MQTPDPRVQAEIFNENVKLHRNSLNGCFPRLPSALSAMDRQAQPLQTVKSFLQFD
jgi:hypothetical protein